MASSVIPRRMRYPAGMHSEPSAAASLLLCDVMHTSTRLLRPHAAGV